MKTAICFFGITRNLQRNTLASIEECLFAPVAKLDPAFKRFCHFNLLDQVSNPRTGEEAVPVDPWDFKLLNCDAAAHTDQAQVDRELNVEEFKKFGDAFQNDFASVRNILRQYYSLAKVTDLLDASNENFDLVIYSRADIRFHRPLLIPRLKPGTLYTPWFDKYHGLNDRFGMGDMPTMISYGRRGLMALQYCRETGHPLMPEAFLSWYARKRGLGRRDLTTLEFSRVRAHGTVGRPDTRAAKKFAYYIKEILACLKLRKTY